MSSSENKKIRLGLIGCGVVANYGHLPAIAAVSDLTLAAVYDPDADRARQSARQFGAERWFTESEAFFESGLDAVTVTSAAPVHRTNILNAARHGKPALCEKPIALEEADAVAMIGAMSDAGFMFFTAFCYRFSLSALKIKELISSGAIGEPRSLRLIYDWDCHGKFEDAEGGSRRINERRAGRMLEGGPMIDCGTHQIDLARWWLASEVVQTCGVGAWLDEYEAPDHMYLHLDHASGAHTLVEINYSYGHTVKHPRTEFVYEILGTDGVIRYDRNANTFDLHNAAGRKELAWHPEKNFEEMYRAFAHALRTGEPGHLPSAEDGLRATVLAREATQQAIERRPIRLARP
jgi:predicted dehydrogenase